MYETWFGLKHRPFVTAPCAEGYFPGRAIEAARAAVESCIERGTGPALVVGPTGVGKTTLGMILQQKYRARFPLAFLPGSTCRSRRTLLQAMLQAFEQPHEGWDEGQMSLALAGFVRDRSTAGLSSILIVDEAELLPLESLEELQAISNLTGLSGWCVRLVLLGNSGVEERLSLPGLSSLNQRIAARCFLQEWQAEETEGYIRQQLNPSSQAAQPLVGKPASRKVYELTGGTPRLIAQLCDHAMFMAATGGRKELDVQGILEAWSDLQQLPPMCSALEPAAAHDVDDSIVEFGTLVDAFEFSQPGTTTEQRVDAIAFAIEQVQHEARDMGDASDSPPPVKMPAECRELERAGGAGEPEPHASDKAEDEVLMSDMVATTWNPFQESFAEEEIVYQRPLGLHSSQKVLASSVLTDEGAALGQVLELLAMERREGVPGVLAGRLSIASDLEALLETATGHAAEGQHCLATRHVAARDENVQPAFGDAVISAGVVADVETQCDLVWPRATAGTSAAVITGPAETAQSCATYAESVACWNESEVRRDSVGSGDSLPAASDATPVPSEAPPRPRRCSRLFSRLRGG